MFNLVTVVLNAKILCHPTYVLSLPPFEIARLRCSSPVSESFLSTSSFRTEKNKSSSLTVLTSVHPYSSLSFVFFFFFWKTIDCDISCVNQYFLFRLESQLGEKPLVLTGLVSLLKGLSDDLLGLLEGLNVQSVSGWKQVVVVEDLDEWPNFGPLGNLLLVVLSSNLQWVSLDTGNQGM